MLIKFFARGLGKGGGPVNYVCGSRDHHGHERKPSPEILYGDPDVIRQVIDSVQYKFKYSTGVISFAPEDLPTSMQQETLMQDFERTAFAGLEGNQYSILWVRHTHMNRVELHFVIQRINLQSGKSYNPAPPGWENRYALLRNAYNYQYGWARPDDPTRARDVQPGNLAQLIHKGHFKELSEIKEAITDLVRRKIERNDIQNRDDLIHELKRTGFRIHRTGKEYISVSAVEGGKHYRLKGTLFAGNFSSATWAEQQGTSPSQTPDVLKAAEARRRLDECIVRIAQQNRARYGITYEGEYYVNSDNIHQQSAMKGNCNNFQHSTSIDSEVQTGFDPASDASTVSGIFEKPEASHSAGISGVGNLGEGRTAPNRAEDQHSSGECKSTYIDPTIHKIEVENDGSYHRTRMESDSIYIPTGSGYESNSGQPCEGNQRDEEHERGAGSVHQPMQSDGVQRTGNADRQLVGEARYAGTGLSMDSGADGDDSVPVEEPLPKFTASPARHWVARLRSHLSGLADILAPIASSLPISPSLVSLPPEEPPPPISRLPRLFVFPARELRKRLAANIDWFCGVAYNIHTSLESYALWKDIQTQSTKNAGKYDERLAASAVNIWREADGVSLRHISEAIDRYSGLKSDEIDTIFDRINAETLHERIWISLQEFIPEGEEATAENVEVACEAFLAKCPDIAEDDVREAVGRFTNYMNVDIVKL